MSSAIESTAPTPVPANAERVDSYEKPLKRLVTLGSVRHRHEQTNEIILVPTPSADPNDPLNWYDYHPPLGLHFEVQTR
jgi:hypothetical protein